MCPLWPLHLIVLYILAICPMWVICQQAPQLIASFLSENAAVHMNQYYYVNVNVTGADLQAGDELSLRTISTHLATAEWNSSSLVTSQDMDVGLFQGKFRVDGHFLGRTEVVLESKRGTETLAIKNGTLPVIVTRPQRVIDTIFTTSVAVFISLIFINFGCAMHWPTVKGVLKRPIGPLIGLGGQFIFMPLITFGLGFLIFPDNPEMRLGMFFTGVAPGGGASNIWTFILGGNLNLSLAMTTISTLAAFGFMPAWLFSLGQVVFADANIVVPYVRIATFIAGLLIPLAIGVAMQKITPRIATFMVKILKGFSTAILLFIIIFAIVTNLYIFELFSWEIIVTGMCIPWLGYFVGYVGSRLLGQSHEDAIAISVEIGVQNTGIAIFLLRYALPQPEADLTTVVPVSVAIMTPIPNTIVFIIQKILGCVRNRNSHKKKLEDDFKPVSPAPEPGVVATVDVK